MEWIHQGALWLHIASGFTALFTGLIALVTKKGQIAHKRTGMVFFVAMLGVSFTAMLMSVIKTNTFLFHIGVFALYQNVAGYRAIQNKSLKPAWFDWALLAISAVNSAMMMATMGIVLLVFGTISATLVFGEFRIYLTHLRNRELPKLRWLQQHIGMMIGTYIATATAFVVVNVSNVHPAWLPWILPTVFGVPLIAWFTRKYVTVHRKSAMAVAQPQTTFSN